MLSSAYVNLQFYLDVCDYRVGLTDTDDFSGERTVSTLAGVVISPLGPWAPEDLQSVLHAIESAVYHRSQAQSRREDRKAQ